MKDVPKFVRQRMAQQSLGDHPDANLLAAFHEGGLTKREREQVLSHLGTCAECRETLALAVPENTAAQPAVTPSSARWLRWPMLRWAGVGAAIVVVAAAVVMQNARRAAEVSKSSAAATVEESQQVKGPSASGSAAPVPTREQAKAPADSVAGNKSAPVVSGRAGTKTGAATEKDLAGKRDEQVKEERLADKVFADKKANVADKGQSAFAGLEQNASPESAQKHQVTQNQPTQTNDLEQLRAQAPSESRDAAANMKTQQPGSSVQGNTGIVMEQKQQYATAQAAPAARANESVEIVAQASPQQGQKAKAQEGARSDLDAASSTRASSPMNRRATTAGGSVVSGGPIVPSGGPLMKAAVGLPSRWRLSKDGALERSTDAGRSWQPVRVARVAPLRALSTVGNDIWAGGSGGALYHSGNNGLTWAQVTVKEGDAALEGDIVRIEFTDAQHGAVTTGAGQTWTTANGGATWTAQRRP